MRIAIVAVILSASPVVCLAQAPKDDGVANGPWKVDAVTEGAKFERCTMTFTTDEGVDVQFTGDAAGLDLSMSSPTWKFGQGKSYSVELAAGTSVLQAEVAASGNTASLPVKDEHFLRSLKIADGLKV